MDILFLDGARKSVPTPPLYDIVMNLNRVILIGRLAADPESRTTAGGQEVVSLRVATNRTWNNQQGQKQEQVEFHSITLWGRLAQIANQYLKKGGLVMIEGRLQTSNWTGQDNVKRYRTEIVAENIQLGPRSSNPSASGSEGSSYQSGNNPWNSGNSSQKFTSQSPVKPAVKDMPEEEIPVINEDEPIRQNPDESIISNNEIEEAEVDLKDIPF
ncbi:MAG: single-strand DNA-binding protein [Parcubacteria group bacterium Gr01-1014_44]|nr:MAG: single-strand DNA-binding protein [Parcubacteria group bacterium Gr01-1014_44]